MLLSGAYEVLCNSWFYYVCEELSLKFLNPLLPEYKLAMQFYAYTVKTTCAKKRMSLSSHCWLLEKYFFYFSVFAEEMKIFGE